MSAKLNATEIKFLNAVYPKAQKIMRINKLLASITIAQGILESSWGNSLLATKANNLFGIKVNDDWNGPAYSKETKEYYDDKTDAVSVTALFRAYDSWEDSMDDRTQYLLTRKIDSSRYRYHNLIGVTDYKEAAKLLVKDGYATDPNYANKLVNIIEKYSLYKYDQEVIEEEKTGDNLYRVRKDWEDEASQLIAASSLENASKVADENKGYKVYNFKGEVVYDPNSNGYVLYRVRLEWDKPQTQLVASRSLNTAKDTAAEHSGYKVFDEDGIVVYDPWTNANVETNNTPGTNKVIIPIIGGQVILSNTAVYRTSVDKVPFVFMSGTYYFYEDKIYNGRVRVTKFKDCIGNCPNHVMGFVKLTDLA